jgi:hypothetical protein
MFLLKQASGGVYRMPGWRALGHRFSLLTLLAMLCLMPSAAHSEDFLSPTEAFTFSVTVIPPFFIVVRSRN